MHNINTRIIIFRHLTVLLLLVPVSFKGYGQDNLYLDTLLKELGLRSTSTDKLNILLEISDFYSEDNPEKARQYADAAMIEAENSNNIEVKASIYAKMGGIFENIEELDLALENYKHSLTLYNTIKDQRGTASMYYQLGDVYKKKGLYKLSLENCIQGLRIFESLQDTSGLSDIYNCLGSLYKYQNDYNRSLQYYNKSLELNNASGDNHGISVAYNNIGVVYSIIGNQDLAVDYYLRSMEASPVKGIDKNNATTLGNIGSCMLDLGNSDEAFKYFMESLEMNLDLGYKRGTANQYRNLGRYYDAIGDYSSAIEYALKAYEIHYQLGRLESLKELTEFLSELYSHQGMYREALEYSRLFKSISDSIFNIEKMKSIAQIETDYLQQKEEEIHTLKDQKKHLLNLLTGIGMLLVIIVVFLFYYRQKVRVKRKNLEIQNIDLEKRRVETELEMNQRELTASTLYMVRNNELINDVIRKLTVARKNLKAENVPVINNIINELKGCSQEDLWKEFEVRFLQVNSEFYNKLQSGFPELTTNEKRLAAFLKLDFSTKEISAITKQSPHSINIARTRLRKKLGLANSDTNISNFLNLL
jgi:tetratricopeptide (TPR) repeat protein